MRNQFGKIGIGCVLAVAGMTSAAYPQAAAPAAPNGSVVVASPTYTSIPMEITVNPPAAEVWKRTYAQTPKEGTPYNLYHGTLEARPVTPTTSKIVYTLFFDNSMLPDDAARAADKERRRIRFMQALQNMKTLVEGGKLN